MPGGCDIAPAGLHDMLYLAYQAHTDIMAPVRACAAHGAARSALAAWACRGHRRALRNLTAA